MEIHQENQSSTSASMASPYDGDIASEEESDLLDTEEIVVEEMAIDGICGVY